MSHSSRCFHNWHGFGTVLAPIPGEQTACPFNVATAIGAVSRAHALVISFQDLQGGGPFASVEFVYPGKPSVFVSVGGLPYGRIIISEDCTNAIVTPLANAVVWREEVRDFDAYPEGSGRIARPVARS